MAHTAVPIVAVDDFGKASWADSVAAADADLTTRVEDLETTVGAGSSVATLTDVALGSPLASGDLLTYNGAAWVNDPPAVVNLATAAVSGRLPLANLVQGTALSVLGVTGNATANEASIVAASDGQVLRRSGTSVGFGAVDLTSANAISGALPLANLPTNFGQIFRSVTNLTNAQTLALPTAEITLTNMTTPGAGLIFLPIGGAILTKTASGAYTNINADAWIRVRYSGGDPFLSYVPNDTASPGITNGSATRVSDLLGTTSPKRVVLVPQQDTEDVDDWGPLGAIMGSSADNNAVVISIDNNGSGNLTGGNVANVVRVIVYYTIETVP